MILAVDIGNSTIAIGLIHQKLVRAHTHFPTELRPVSIFKSLFDGFLKSSETPLETIESAVISSVVPALIAPVSAGLRHLLGKNEFIIQPGIKVGMKIHYHPPGALGSDRVVNAFATKTEYGYPAICIDFGTATTFSVLDQKGDFAGGAILPGITAFTDILSKTTSLLPHVSFAKPPAVIARTTVHGIQSGLFFGYISLLEGLIGRIQKELHCKPIVVATGGRANVIKNETHNIDYYDDNLIFHGLELLYRYNQTSDSNIIWKNL